MNSKKGILFFGFLEVAIGVITLSATFQNLACGISIKPLNALIFVIISSLLSTSLGAGILFRRPYARKLLIFFAGWIILSKILILAGIMKLNGAIETTVPLSTKNIISVIYHFCVILYFHQPIIKAKFEKKLLLD